MFVFPRAGRAVVRQAKEVCAAEQKAVDTRGCGQAQDKKGIRRTI